MAAIEVHPSLGQNAFLQLFQFLLGRSLYVHRILINSEQSVLGGNALRYLLQGRHNVPLAGLGSCRRFSCLLLSIVFQVVHLNLHARDVRAVSGLSKGDIVVQLAEEVFNFLRIVPLRHFVHLLLQ